MTEVVIVNCKRSAIGNFLGSLSNISAVELGAKAIQSVIEGMPIKIEMIDEVIMGQVLQAGCGQNPARQAAIMAGLSHNTPAITINKVCGSGMKSIHFAYNAIKLNQAQIIIAGGQENMSQAPHIIPSSRMGKKMGHLPLKDSLLTEGLTCAISNEIHMGITAENLASKYNISRQDQDAFALASQIKASKAQKSKCFEAEIFNINIEQKKQIFTFNQDEFIKHNCTLENIAQLKPAFLKEGTVTAANASGVNDGSAALLIMSEKKAQELNLKPMVRIIGFASVGVEPVIMGIGPAKASKKLLDMIDWKVEDLDLIESNEAFAAQALAVNYEMSWDLNKVNVNGGAIALGHPIGASGARIVTSLIYEMQRRQSKKGLATMCIGGGQGIASAFELI